MKETYLEEEYDEEYTERLQYALIEGFIHGDTDSLEYILENDWCFDIIRFYLCKNANEQFLAEESKKNLYLLVEQVRNPDLYKDNKERLKKWDWSNEIVELLNTTTDQNKVAHYRSELIDRCFTRKKLAAFVVEYNLPIIYLSIMADFHLLESLDNENDFYHDRCHDDIINPFITYSIHKIVLKEKLPLPLYDLYKIRAILHGKQQLQTYGREEAITVEDVDGNDYSYSFTEEEYQQLQVWNNERLDREVLSKLNRFIKWEMNQEKQKVISKKK